VWALTHISLLLRGVRVTPEITGHDLEYYLTEARVRLGKPVIEPEEYVQLAAERAELGHHLAAAVYYALAMVRFLPNTTRALELAQNSAEMLKRVPPEVARRR
jgi:hypothetical protein